MFANRFKSKPPLRRRTLRRLVGVLIAALLTSTVTLISAPPASADTSSFRGMNWARKGDNFTTSTLVLDGLSGSDSYATVLAKADAIYASMANLLGVNTVRLPVNTHTVGSAWWNAYRGAIDAATARGFKVILAFWEDGAAASSGRITNMAAFNSMWDTVVAQYGANGLVHFEPMNEPHGYSASDWLNVAANWINARPSIPKGRILVGGTGFSQDLRPVCNDSRFTGTLLSFHFYAFFYGQNDYAGWRNLAQTRLGNCASRAVVTEFGAPMDTGLDYGNPNSSDNFVRYIRAITDIMREQAMGGTYWPALGGKITAGQSYDWYSLFALQGSGTNLSLSIRSASGADRLRHAWGDNGTPGGPVAAIKNRNSGRCVDVVSASSANGAEIIQWDCHGGTNQQWEARPAGENYVQLVSRHSGKCLDISGASTANNARAVLWSCTTGTNQQWQLRDTGGYLEIIARHSGRCLDVIGSSTANGTRLQQYDCRGTTSQQWTR